MNLEIPRQQHCRLALFGTQSLFSRYCFQLLTNSACAPVHVFLPGLELSANKLPRRRLLHSGTTPAAQDSMEHLANTHNIPCSHDQLLDPRAFLAKLRLLEINLILIACFPYKIPDTIYNNICSLNIHPSALPAYKGPSPLFWQLFNNEKNLAVSLHYLSDQWDGGTIVSQHSTTRKKGSDEASLNWQLATMAEKLVCDAMQGKTATFDNALEESYYPAPKAENFQLMPHWQAQHAFDFMIGTQSWRQNYRLVDGDENILMLRKAIAIYRQRNGNRAHPRGENQVEITFADGVVVAELANDV